MHSMSTPACSCLPMTPSSTPVSPLHKMCMPLKLTWMNWAGGRILVSSRSMRGNVKYYMRAITTTAMTTPSVVLSWATLEQRKACECTLMLMFCHHASAVIVKATLIMSVIRSSFALIEDATLPLLFSSLLSILTLLYGNLVWELFNRADQKMVERVQRWERLQWLQLPSLYIEERFRRYRMIHMYQLYHGGIDYPEGTFTLANDYTTRGHPY